MSDEIFLQSHRLYAGDNMYRVAVSVCDTENFIKWALARARVTAKGLS